MHYNYQHTICTTYNLNSIHFNYQYLLSRNSSCSYRILRSSLKPLSQFFLFRQIFFSLLAVLLMSASYGIQALTSLTANPIHGHAPYLTFDGGHTIATNIDTLLGITLSDGSGFTPATNNSSVSSPIELPNTGESFADIDMFVPINSNSIELSSLIGPPNNYWYDDDGDGQGQDGISVTGNLSLTILDKDNQTVARNTTLDICKAPYKIFLNTTGGILSTNYGLPRSSVFSASNTTYFITPKVITKVCFAQPSLKYGKLFSGSQMDFRGPASMWNEDEGFIPQSTEPSSYGLNFPTTGANNLYFNLKIAGSGPLAWDPVSHNGITAKMRPNSTGTSVEVVLTGPIATEEQWNSTEPGTIAKPLSLPQAFELVGKDSRGNAVVKYGFEIKQWFVTRGYVGAPPTAQESWCNKIGYRLPNVKDLTNAVGPGLIGATPSSSGNHYQRRIGGGFVSEWGDIMNNYDKDRDAGFDPLHGDFWTSNYPSTPTPDGKSWFEVTFDVGAIQFEHFGANNQGICVTN